MDKTLKSKISIQNICMNPALNADYMKEALFLQKFSNSRNKKIFKVPKMYQDLIYKIITVKHGGKRYIDILWDKMTNEKELMDVISKLKIEENVLQRLKGQENEIIINFQTIEEELIHLNKRKEMLNLTQDKYNQELYKIYKRKNDMDANIKLIAKKIASICNLIETEEVLNKKLDIAAYAQEITKYDALINQAEKTLIRCENIIKKLESKKMCMHDSKKITLIASEIEKLNNKRGYVNSLKVIMIRLRESQVDRFTEIEYENKSR